MEKENTAEAMLERILTVAQLLLDENVEVFVCENECDLILNDVEQPQIEEIR